MQIKNALFLALCSFQTYESTASNLKGGFKNKFQEGGFKNKFQKFIKANITDITCSDDWACDLRNGEEGTFVCRSYFNPLTGVEASKARCIPTDRAWTTDECGCCGEDCPSRPDFIKIDCGDQSDLTWGDSDTQVSRSSNIFQDENQDKSRDGRKKFEGGVIVCRDLFDPFTGDLKPVTIPIRPDHALEGDTCGCCNDECPIKGEPQFDRPELVELDWCDADAALTACTVPKKKFRGDKDEEIEDEQDREGVFVCRSWTDKLTGEAESKSVCIPTDGAWETDQCGCCEDECPTRPENIDCSAEEDQCERRNGESGVFVCRSLFHPVDGSSLEKTICVPPEKTIDTADECGCCGDDCPVTPAGGFDDEESQILSFALESPDGYVEDDSSAFHAAGAGAFIVGIFLALFAL